MSFPGDYEALYRAGWQLWLAPGPSRSSETALSILFFLRFWLDLLSVTPFWIRVIHGGHILPHWERFQMLCSLVKQGFSVVLGQGLLRVFKIFRSEP